MSLKNENPERSSKKIYVKNWDEKELAQKSYEMIKGKKTTKSQKSAKSKKKIRAKKAEASKTKNLG